MKAVLGERQYTGAVGSQSTQVLNVLNVGPSRGGFSEEVASYCAFKEKSPNESKSKEFGRMLCYGEIMKNLVWMKHRLMDCVCSESQGRVLSGTE